MGTKFRTPEEKFKYRMSKQHSVEANVVLVLKPRKSWSDGLSFLKLKAEIERRRGKEFCDGRIYEAISLINRFGKHYGIYIRSEHGEVADGDNNKRIEYRYFVPTEQYDISKEEKNLGYRKEIIELKEEHLKHHEVVTIPQEQKLAELQR